LGERRWLEFTCGRVDRTVGWPFLLAARIGCSVLNLKPVTLGRVAVTAVVALLMVQALLSGDVFAIVVNSAVSAVYSWIAFFKAAPDWEAIEVWLAEGGVAPIELAFHVRACSRQRKLSVLTALLPGLFWQDRAALVVSALAWYCFTCLCPRRPARQRQRQRKLVPAVVR
jgi:hypothetical protein